MYTIQYVPEVDDHWKEASKLLQKALDRSFGEMTIADVKNGLYSGQFGLILIHEDDELRAAGVLEFKDYHQISAIKVLLLGGEKMRDWIPAMHDFVMQFVMDKGIHRIEIQGREGWVKMLRDYGFKKAYTTIIKEIDYGRR